MAILGLDYGEKTIGVAVSDELNKLAFPLTTLRRQDEISLKKNVATIKDLIREYQINTIVIGFPKHLSNTISVRCEKTIAFRDKLQRNFKKVNIILWDERLSSIGATRLLAESGASKEEARQHIDQAAAAFILQGYLDSVRNQ